jgi:hypothetical protein
MRRDYQLAIILAVAAIPAGTALMAAPGYLHLTGNSLAVTFWGGALLTLALIVLAVAVALRGEAQAPPRGHGQRMTAILGMAFCGAGFMAFVILFFIQRPQVNERWTWAALTASESDALYEHLRGKEQHSFHVACSGTECSDLATSFDRLFKRLGWPSFVGDGGFLATGVTGILINPDDAGAKLLKSAIETNTILRPDLGSPRGKDAGPTMLVIGAKPEVLASGPILATAAPGILLDIAFEVLPRISPPDGTIHVFDIRQEQAGIHAALIEHQFNPSEMIDWKQRFPEWPIFGVSKGEIISTTNDSVFYAVIPINLIFREMIPDRPGLPPVEIGGVLQATSGGVQMRSGRVMMTQQSSFRVGRIYPQTPYVIYFVNRTEYLVDIEVPSEGKVQDFSKIGADFETKLNMKLGRTTGMHLSPSPNAPKSPPAPPPPTPLPPSTPEKR